MCSFNKDDLVSKFKTKVVFLLGFKKLILKTSVGSWLLRLSGLTQRFSKMCFPGSDFSFIYLLQDLQDSFNKFLNEAHFLLTNTKLMLTSVVWRADE